MYCLILVDGTDILSRNVGKNNNLGHPVLEKNEDLNYIATVDRNLSQNENIKELSTKTLAWLTKLKAASRSIAASANDWVLSIPTLRRAFRKITSNINQQMHLYNFHLKHFKTLKTTPTYFDLFRSSSGSFVVPC